MQKLYADKAAAVLAARRDAMRRGYDAATAEKFCTGAQVRKYGATQDQWEAWTIHHVVETTTELRVTRRPLA